MGMEIIDRIPNGPKDDDYYLPPGTGEKIIKAEVVPGGPRAPGMPGFMLPPSTPMAPAPAPGPGAPPPPAPSAGRASPAPPNAPAPAQPAGPGEKVR